MAYNELVKNFKRIRDYMREFYVYGFKSRDEFTKRAHVHMTMNDAVWKAGLVIICSFARQQKAKICFSQSTVV